MIFFKVVFVLLKLGCLYADNTMVKYKKYPGTIYTGGSALVDCAKTINVGSVGLDFSITSASCTGLPSSWLEDKHTEVDHIYMLKVGSEEIFDPPMYLYYNTDTDNNRYYSRRSPIDFAYGSTIVLYISSSNSKNINVITLRHNADYLLRIRVNYGQATVKCEARYNGAASEYTETISYQFTLNKIEKITFRIVTDGYEVYFDDEWMTDFKDTTRPYLSTDIVFLAFWVASDSDVYLHGIDFSQ